MSVILNIDTATEFASVGLTREGKEVVTETNGSQKDHAAWIHPAIGRILDKAMVNMAEIEAVAVTGGPGSYTGLRVGMATAKGLCFTLGVPLISESTLKVMALAAVLQTGMPAGVNGAGMLFCPMIDARRMEVFTALYTEELDEIMPPLAMVLDATSFNNQPASKPITFFGSGSAKWKGICMKDEARFAEVNYSCQHLGILSYQKFVRREFVNLAYSEPGYVEEFYTNKKRDVSLLNRLNG